MWCRKARQAGSVTFSVISCRVCLLIDDRWYGKSIIVSRYATSLSLVCVSFEACVRPSRPHHLEGRGNSSRRKLMVIKDEAPRPYGDVAKQAPGIGGRVGCM